MTRRKRNDGRKDLVGKKEPIPDVHLYVPCPQCDMSRGYCPVCVDGYIKTGFTQARYDELIKANDRMLVLLEDLSVSGSGMDIEIRRRLIKELERYTSVDVEGARSRVNQPHEETP